MSRLVKLEKMLERGFDKLRRKETPRDLVEAIPDVLDEIEDRLESSGGRGRVFPYDRVVIAFRVPAEEKPAARALFQDLPERIRQRLSLRGAPIPPSLEIQVRLIAAPGEGWGERLFRAQFRRASSKANAKAAPAPASRAAPPPPVRLRVVRGKGGSKEYELRLARINLGRLDKVASTTGRPMRRNHVWFAAGEDTVSRAHAHLERVGADFLLFDDGSSLGTRVLRDGDEIELMPNASRGVRLADGDKIELGKGCVIEVGLGANASGSEP